MNNENSNLETDVLLNSEKLSNKKQKWCIYIIIIIIVFFVIGCFVGALVVRKKQDLISIFKKQYDEISITLQNKVNQLFLHEQLEMYSSKIHQMGSEENLKLAEFMLSNWKAWGLRNSSLFKYKVNKTLPNLLYPSTLSLIVNGSVKINFSTIEMNGALPRYHSYSTAGYAKGKFVYINYGLMKDLNVLDKMNISYCGKNIIPIVRLGYSFRTAKVKNLMKRCESDFPGALLMYPDPWDYSVDQNDSNSTPDNTPVYPNSWWLPGDAAVFGNLKMKSGLQSPGLPTTGGMIPTVNFSDYLTPFPVQPISYNDAKQLFIHMNNNKKPKEWERSLPEYLESCENCALEVNVTNQFAEVTISNVIGWIPGSVERDRYIILGNHRDAWATGANDPGSGTVILQQVVNLLTEAFVKGDFVPYRTIIFANWDGEEEGLLGSSEFTSQFKHDLSVNAVAYVNMDCPIKGHWSFEARSTPLLGNTMIDSSKNTVFDKKDERLYSYWLEKQPSDDGEPKINYLGGGSDHNNFAYVLGIPSSYPQSISFEYPWSVPAYHTKYDTISMMEKFIDPDLKQHALLSRFVLDYIIRLSSSPIIPYDITRLAVLMQRNLPELMKEMYEIDEVRQLRYAEILNKTVEAFHVASYKFHSMMTLKYNDIIASPQKLWQINNLLLNLPRSFLSREGLPNRPFYLNILLSTKLQSSYLGSFYTGVSDALYLYRKQVVNIDVVFRQLSLLTQSINEATLILHGGFISVLS